MITKKYLEVIRSLKKGKDAQLIDNARKILDGIKPAFLEKYFDGDLQKYSDAEMSLIRQIYPLVALMPNLKDKTVLDLGCGSASIEAKFSYLNHRMYEPWLCRALLEIGAKPIGVDINSNDGEKFENYIADFYKPNSLSFLRDNSVDIANAGAIFNLPGFDEDKLRKNLIPQLERIVKPEGFFVYQD